MRHRYLLFALLGLCCAQLAAQESPAATGDTQAAPIQAALPRLGFVLPAFSFQREDGSELGSAALNNEVWIADFIYTYCSGPCPAMTSAMGRLQEKMRALPGLRLVTFTVDPERDTKEALANYAQRSGADPARWAFLRGTPETTASLMRTGFKLGDPGDPVNHSTRFVLVDRGLVVHGVYDYEDPAGMERLARDTHMLLGVEAAMDLSFFPPLNATLNGLAAILLFVGWRRIRRKDIAGHKRAMLAAFTCSAVFLACYLTYHALKAGVVTSFPEAHPTARIVYLTILGTHTVLAVAVLPFIINAIRHGLKDNRPKHVRAARIALPVWFYVSVTGVIIYFMLYQWFPA